MNAQKHTWVLCAFTAPVGAARQYAFKTFEDYVPGDILVVPSDRGIGYACVEVVRMDPNFTEQPQITYKWVVQKVDPSNMDPKDTP